MRIPWVKHGYFTATGNSFAAPVITGISALIKSKHPELCPLGIKLVINTLAKKWADYGKITPPLLTLDELSRETSVPKESLERYIEEGIIFPEEGNENKEPLFYEQNIVKSIRNSYTVITGFYSGRNNRKGQELIFSSENLKEIPFSSSSFIVFITFSFLL